METFGGDNFEDNCQRSVDTPQLAAGVVNQAIKEVRS
jgi:hypothetical protein